MNQEGSAAQRVPHQLPVWKRILVWLAAGFVRLYGRTLRFEKVSPDLAQALGYRGSRIIVFWHNRLLYAPAVLSNEGYLLDRPLYGLVSASRDGALLAAFLNAFKVRVIRGSGFQRGIQAYREMLHTVHGKGDVVITPDGSRGPVYRFNKGAARLALSSGCPIILVSWNARRPWRLRTWDRFQIPKPFSRVAMEVKWIDALLIQQYSDSTSLADFLERELLALTNDYREHSSPGKN